MNVGWFTYQPGLQGQLKNSAGGASWTRYLFDKLSERGHKILWYADNKAPANTFVESNVKKADILVINWRWAMPEYPDRHEAYQLQMILLEKAIKAHVKVIVHDQDHMISTPDYELLKVNHIQIYAPEMQPRAPEIKELHFPFPFEKIVSARNRLPFMTSIDMMYIGNVYGRYWDACKFLRPFSKKFKTVVYGNWLESGPDRPGSEEVRKDMPDVEFKGRIGQDAIVNELASASSTIHLFKPSYAPVGFLTLRWAEAAAAYTPAFIPSNFWMPEEIKTVWADYGIFVNNGEEMAKNFSILKEKNWYDIATMQREFIRNKMSIQQWFNVIENTE